MKSNFNSTRLFSKIGKKWFGTYFDSISLKELSVSKVSNSFWWDTAVQQTKTIYYLCNSSPALKGFWWYRMLLFVLFRQQLLWDNRLFESLTFYYLSILETKLVWFPSPVCQSLYKLKINDDSHLNFFLSYINPICPSFFIKNIFLNFHFWKKS